MFSNCWCETVFSSSKQIAITSGQAHVTNCCDVICIDCKQWGQFPPLSWQGNLNWQWKIRRSLKNTRKPVSPCFVQAILQEITGYLPLLYIPSLYHYKESSLHPPSKLPYRCLAITVGRPYFTTKPCITKGALGKRTPLDWSLFLLCKDLYSSFQTSVCSFFANNDHDKCR